MRRTALALAALVAGCAGSPSTPGPRPPGTVTRVLTFQAYDDAGLLPHLVRTASVTGACQGGSTVHPGRADAWRCRAGEAEFDPCFANHTGDELACARDPWSADVVSLRPPAPLGRAGQNRNDPGGPPWFLELVDGTRCGRTPPSGYRCATGAEIGDPDRSGRVWTVPAGGVSVDVVTAWY